MKDLVFDWDMGVSDRMGHYDDAYSAEAVERDEERRQNAIKEIKRIVKILDVEASTDECVLIEYIMKHSKEFVTTFNVLGIIRE